MKNPIVILGASRRALRTFRGALSGIPAPKLGAAGIASALAQARLNATRGGDAAAVAKAVWR